MKINNLNLHQYNIHQATQITDLLYNIKYYWSKTKPRLSYLAIIKIMLKFKINIIFAQVLLLLLSKFFIWIHKKRTQFKTTVIQNTFCSLHCLPNHLRQKLSLTKQIYIFSENPSVFQGLLRKRDLILYFKDCAYVLQQNECVTH